eukprot:TRINITY_DN831_c0_g3_i1.p2 TRINITY_DN831_c0_g3~~TRINITY_DN831_c0_g3_i1.p2  ORF type:complete len:198 (+),score=38.55 TRINITY_DN831_c0_g3_i1:59-595(+)
MGMGGGYGPQGMLEGGDPNDPHGGVPPPPQPPSWWQSLVKMLHGMMFIVERIAMLVNENTSAFVFLLRALLELSDRSGFLYAEVLGFVLRLFGFKRRNAQKGVAGPNGVQQGLPAPSGVKGAAAPLGKSVVGVPAGELTVASKGKMGMPPMKPSGMPGGMPGQVAAPGAAWDNVWGSS